MAFVTTVIVTYIIFQALYVLKNLKKIFPHLFSSKWCKLLQKICRVGPVIVFITASIVIYFHKIIELNFHKSSPKWIIGVNSLFFVYLWLNTTFNYFAAMVTKPGKPPRQTELYANSQAEHDDPKLEFCSQCHRLRSYGTHHCNTCKNCVRMLCHHSNFVNNCIGITNFAYYFCFLTYSYVGLAYLTYMTYAPFQACFIHDHTKADVSLHYPALSFYICQDIGEIPLFFIAVVVAWIVIGTLLLFHIILLAADLSYNSFIKHIKESHSLLKFSKNLITKCCSKHRRVKFSVLVKCRKKSWKYFLFPSFNILPDNISVDDIFDEDDHNYVQMI